MWHASATGHGGEVSRPLLDYDAARTVLEGVGDARLGEWVECHNGVVHVRRRLSEQEQDRYSLDVLDVRGTPEAARRVRRLGARISAIPPKLLAEELGLTPE